MSATKKTKNHHAAKVQLSCRVSYLVKLLIALERKTENFSEGQAVESLILRASTSPAAHNLILKEAAKDPHFAALANALAAKQN